MILTSQPLGDTPVKIKTLCSTHLNFQMAIWKSLSKIIGYPSLHIEIYWIMNFKLSSLELNHIFKSNSPKGWETSTNVCVCILFYISSHVIGRCGSVWLYSWCTHWSEKNLKTFSPFQRILSTFRTNKEQSIVLVLWINNNKLGQSCAKLRSSCG